MRFLPRIRLFRNRITGETSRRFLHILPQKVTVDPDYIVPWEHPKMYSTLFEEIEIVPPFESIDQEALQLMSLTPGTCKMDQQSFLEELVKVLKIATKQLWSASKFHVMLHGSGHKSRIMSSIIRQLFEEEGSDWLGQILFGCWGEECVSFDKIMEREGWDKSQYVSCKNFGEIYPEALNFSTVWEKINGPMRIPFNQHCAFLHWVRGKNLIPKSDELIQICSAYAQPRGPGSLRGNLLGSRFSTSYDIHESLSFPLLGSEEVIPLRHYDFLKVVIQSNIRLGSDIRKVLADYINPSLIDIERFSRKGPYPHFPQQLFVKAVEDYSDSWYAQRVRPYASKRTTSALVDSPWWSNWTSAAFIDHLQKEGYEVLLRS